MVEIDEPDAHALAKYVGKLGWVTRTQMFTWKGATSWRCYVKLVDCQTYREAQLVDADVLFLPESDLRPGGFEVTV